MRDNALYFPYIAVPNTTWLVRTLLYWDKLYSIVPFDHTFDEQHMRDLVSARLIEPIFPREHLYQLPLFADSFIHYVRTQKAAMRRKADALFMGSRPTRVPIHTEKLGELGDKLVEWELADRMDEFWYNTEPWVANHFMAYLAAVLGQLPSVSAAPLTDNQECFRVLGGSMPALRGSEARIQSRTLLLEKILPVPADGVDVATLADFKTDQGERLRTFRQMIEEESIRIAGLDPDDRDDALAVATERLSKERDKIATKMSERWTDVVLNPIFSVLGAAVTFGTKVPLGEPVAATGAGASLISALYRAYQGHREYRSALTQPLAYAAFFKHRFPSTTAH